MEDAIIISCVAAFVLSGICSLALIPCAIRFCVKRRLYDRPNARKIHHATNIPRLGGVAFVPSAALAVGLAAMLTYAQGNLSANTNFNIISVSIGCGVVFLAGVIDDIKGLRPQKKLLIQAIAACALPVSGASVGVGACGGEAAAHIIDFMLTAFIVVYVVNSINFIDGIDGLCGIFAMLVALACLPFFVCNDDLFYALVASSVVGAMATFLPFNIFGAAERGTKTFMGDAGSLTLGFIISAMCLKVLAYSDATVVQPLCTKATVLSLLAVPTIDLCKVAVDRALRHKNILMADKSHIHHRLMAAGLSQRQALAVIVAVVLLLLFTSNVVLRHESIVVTALFLVFCMAVFYILLEFAIKRKRIKADI